MVLDGSLDTIEAPPTADATADPDGDGVANEIPTSLVDYLEFYLLNYFKPATDQQSAGARRGASGSSTRVGCTSCHVPNLPIDHDRRVADVETAFDPARGDLQPASSRRRRRCLDVARRRQRLPAAQAPPGEPFLVRDIFTDFKRHDLGPASTSATTTARCGRSS